MQSIRLSVVLISSRDCFTSSRAFVAAHWSCYTKMSRPFRRMKVSLTIDCKYWLIHLIVWTSITRHLFSNFGSTQHIWRFHHNTLSHWHRYFIWNFAKWFDTTIVLMRSYMINHFRCLTRERFRTRCLILLYSYAWFQLLGPFCRYFSIWLWCT